MTYVMLRRIAVAALVAASLNVAGCGTESDEGDREKAATEVRAAVGATTALPHEGVFNVIVREDLAAGSLKWVKGEIDCNAGTASVTWTSQVNKDRMYHFIRVEGDDMWWASGATLAGGPWLRLDATRLPPDDVLGRAAGCVDPFGLRVFSDSIVTAKRIDEEFYEGELDLRSRSGWARLHAEEFGLLGEDLAAVPFRAKVDWKGRLLDVWVGDDDSRLTVTLRSLGLPQETTKSPGETRAAPDSAYREFERPVR